MNSDLVQRVAGVVAGAALEQLSVLLEALRDGATDARSARRVLERRAPGAVGAGLAELFGDEDFEVVLASLETSVAAVTQVRREIGMTEIVWTGPATRALSVRPTRAVVLELIQRARTSLTIVTFASHDIADLLRALDEARLGRGVRTRMVIETADDRQRGEGPDVIAALKHLPWAVPIYRWPKERRGTKGASMHVKCVVQDRAQVLVTSANLTSAAMDRNMELGLRVQGGRSAEVIEQHYDDLIAGGVLRRLEADV